MTLAFIRDPAYIKKPERGADWLGLGAMTTGIASLQYVLERGQREDWFSSPSIVILAILSVVTLVFFVVRELRDPFPFVDLRVFRSRAFAGGNIIGIISGFGLYGLNLVLPLFLSGRVGALNATQTGLALLPGAIATAFSMQFATFAQRQFGVRPTIIVGLLIFAWGSLVDGIVPQSIRGILGTSLAASVARFCAGFHFCAAFHRHAFGSGSGGFAQRHADCVRMLIRQFRRCKNRQVAVLEAIEQWREESAYASLAASAALVKPNVARLFSDGAGSHAQILSQLNGMVTQNAMVIAYNYVFRVCALIFLFSIPTVFLLRSGRAQAKGAIEPVHAE